MFLGFGLDAWITVVTVLGMFTILLFTKWRSDLVCLGAVGVLYVRLQRHVGHHRWRALRGGGWTDAYWRAAMDSEEFAGHAQLIFEGSDATDVACGCA